MCECFCSVIQALLKTGDLYNETVKVVGIKTDEANVHVALLSLGCMLAR
jgi:hypothetical protein